jgi:hypothetical protein
MTSVWIDWPARSTTRPGAPARRLAALTILQDRDQRRVDPRVDEKADLAVGHPSAQGGPLADDRRHVRRHGGRRSVGERDRHHDAGGPILRQQVLVGQVAADQDVSVETARRAAGTDPRQVAASESNPPPCRFGMPERQNLAQNRAPSNAPAASRTRDGRSGAIRGGSR